MVILTASGALAEEYKKYFEAEIISFRKLDDAGLIQKVKTAKVIIHNSANIHSTGYSELFDDNILLTHRLLKTVKSENPSLKFINIGSMSYLKNSSSYQPAEMMTNYALTKFISELSCLKSGLENITSVRFSTLFYSNPLRDGLSKLICEAALKKNITLINYGEARRDFLPLKIAVQYLNKIVNLKSPLRQTYNIASGKSLSFADITGHLCENIPDLTVSNTIVLSSPEVLSEFGTEDIDSLGRIDFSIFREIDDALQKRCGGT